MKRSASTPARSRPRKKAAAPETTASAEVESPSPTVPDASEAPAEPTDGRNVDPLEGKLSVAVGVLLLVAALFPRSLKQLLMLSLGGGLLYRGMTGHCSVYQALGVDTTKQPLLPRLKL